VIPRPNLLRCLGLAAFAAFLCSACLRPERENKEESAAPDAGTAPILAPTEPAGPKLAAAPPAPPTAAAGAIVEVSGEQFLARVRGTRHKATLVNVWASWCGPCKEEFPMLITLRDKLRKRGIEVLFVSVDEVETHQAARTFASEHGMTDELLVAQRPLGPFKQALNPDWPGMLPATFLFDRAGELRHFWGGPVYENELMPIIEDFLAGKVVPKTSLPGLSPGLDFRETPP
jgi:thiol-disulfide isomerase/thioredoxin